MTRLGRACTIAAWTVGVLGAATLPVCAQALPTAHAAAANQAAPSADALFADASAKEAAVRKALVAGPRQPTVLKAVRTVVADFEAVVRHHPTSGYCDDALWRGAALARTAFETFGESRERTTALRLLKLLASQYPTSKFARTAPEQVAWLDAHPASVTTPTVTSVSAPAPMPPGTAALPAAAGPGSPAPAPASAASPLRTALPTDASASGSSKLVSVKAIRRAVMKDLVRVVIELDDEIAFHDERIDGPPRVFIDLPSTRANMALIDQTLRFDSDNDIVRQIRIGRHPNAVTRVVLEATGVSSYSVYPLYSPFRLVIDCLRAAPLVAESAPDKVRQTAAERPLVPVQAPAAAVVAPRPQAPAATPASAASPSPAPPVSVVRAERQPLPPSSATAAPAAVKPPAVLPALVAPALRTAPPPLPSRRVAWHFQMPSGRAVALTDAALLAAQVPAAAPALTAGASGALLPPKPPERNLAGGLSIARQLGLGVSRIVIDPGHGGHDPGAKGSGVTEAELVLDVALRLEQLLAKLPGVEVVLTRRENTFVSLQERTAIANRESADLFLSIHANASNLSSARGVETYFLNFASNQRAAAVAARENATSGQTMGSLQDVITSIALNSKVDESRDFATYVQREMLASLKRANNGLRDLGVKQAPFVVLIGAAMPSILAEISFVTNPQEAKLLKSTSYRQKIAAALFEGVRKYQGSLTTAPAVAAQQQH